MKQLMLTSSLFVLICSSISAVSGGNVFCYFASWTTYRPGNGKFDVSNIDPSLCTHISFAFVGVGENATVRIIDPWESNEDYGPKGFEHLVGLKQQNPNLKVLLSMGGWNEGSSKFSQVARNPELRKRLALNVLAFLKQWKFDGFDLDWEYPGFRDGSNPAIDRDDYTALMSDLRDVLAPEGYILSGAVSGAINRIEISYDIPALNKLMDYINIMVYDFHGSFDPYVGHVSPLYASSLDSSHGDNVTYNVASGIQYWLDNGADPSKINLGIVTYGRSFTLADESKTELYAPIQGGGKEGPYTRQEGILGYNEICELHSDWTYVWDDEQKVPHRISGNQWVGYEDVRSITYKTDYAISKNLGGMMVWAFDNDDFRGICGDKYPLMNVLQKIR
ncbi:acidic mammalian chitinase-like [Leptinotarsa decemlineata]|uniref:acidic mammalian chitinase-like n=1 Tax=Leptinotarsa decemlineata TaxID=7539 RepID=UPI003D30D513